MILPWRWVTGLLLLLMLSACAGGKPQTVGNAYVEQAKTLVAIGAEAMQRERWDYAQRVFARALTAAQLADDAVLVGQVRYSLGSAQAAAGDADAARRTLAHARAWAGRHGDELTSMRAHLRSALLSSESSDAGSWLDVPGRMPADVHLMAGRLAQRQGRAEIAEREYGLALRRPDNTRAAMLTQAQARLGLAMLARDAKDLSTAGRESEKALTLLRRVGAPRLTAHTLLFLAQLPIDSEARVDALERALTIYHALDDSLGQRQCLEWLAQLEGERGRDEAVAAYRQRLQQISAP